MSRANGHQNGKVERLPAIDRPPAVYARLLPISGDVVDMVDLWTGKTLARNVLVAYAVLMEPLALVGTIGLYVGGKMIVRELWVREVLDEE
jgi:hypothetical protein